MLVEDLPFSLFHFLLVKTKYLLFGDNICDDILSIECISVAEKGSVEITLHIKVKKEIFTRYNSGIIALKPQEIERAAYINDILVRDLKTKLEQDGEFLKKCQLVLMPKRKQTFSKN